MKIVRIESLENLALFTPALVKLHEELEGRWEADLDTGTFLARLIQNFIPSNYYFGELKDDQIIYFAVICQETKSKAFFWLFYMNPNYRDQTRLVIQQLKSFLLDAGFDSVRLSTTRITSAYNRWLEKHGAQQQEIIYKINLK